MHKKKPLDLFMSPGLRSSLKPGLTEKYRIHPIFIPPICSNHLTMKMIIESENHSQ